MSTRTMAPGLPLAALCLVAGLVSAGPATAQDVGQPPGLLVDIGGYRLHLYCEGESAGGPIVVLSAGGGGLAVDWAMVQEPVARSTRVCSYDRANEGFSDLGPNPRSAHQEVFELHAALQTAGEWPPYVLVGHSFGGLVVRVFADRYPTEVEGAVLVEPLHESARLGYRGQFVRVRTIATARSIPPPRALDESPPTLMVGPDLAQCRQSAASSTIFGPHAKLPTAAQNARLWIQRHPKCHALSDDFLPEELAAVHAGREADPQPLGDLPLVVIAGAQISVPPDADPAEWRREKGEHMEDLARLSRSGRLVTDPRSGHSVHLDNPAVVIAAIEQVLLSRAR